MAVYKTLDLSGAISFSNWILSSNIISVTDQAISYPASNLKNPIMSKTYRTTKLFNEHNGYFQIVFDLGSEKLPTVIALINSNITKTTGNGLYLIGSSTYDLSGSQVIYDSFPLYETKTKVLRWYLDTPSSGTAAEKRWWGVRFYPNDWGNDFTSDTYFEIGNIWLGEYQDLRHDYNSKYNQFDNSKRSESFGGASFVDSNNKGISFSVSMPFVTRTNRQELVSNYNTYRSSSHVLVDLEPFIDDITSSTGGLNSYYGKIGDQLGLSFEFSGYTNIDLTFTESVA